MMKKSQGGRPRHNEQAKTTPIGMRVTPDFKAMLVAAAEQSGRTLTGEIEFRIRESLGLQQPEPSLREIVQEEVAIGFLRAMKAMGASASIANGQAAPAIQPE